LQNIEAEFFIKNDPSFGDMVFDEFANHRLPDLGSESQSSHRLDLTGTRVCSQAHVIISRLSLDGLNIHIHDGSTCIQSALLVSISLFPKLKFC
jgi:hypothetical protein